jgi:hypothetical protein
MRAADRKAFSTHAFMLAIESFELAYTDDERAVPVLQVRGRVPCGAWTDPTLMPVEATEAAIASGVLEFLLMAKQPPSGTFIVETFAHSLTAVYEGELPAWVREVQVKSASNSASYCVETSRPLSPHIKRARGVAAV